MIKEATKTRKPKESPEKHLSARGRGRPKTRGRGQKVGNISSQKSKARAKSNVNS